MASIRQVSFTTWVVALLMLVTSAHAAHLMIETCSSGLNQGNACCASTCAVCGGPLCNSNMMGDKCCVSKIRQAGLDCRSFPPPCVIPYTTVPPAPTPTSTRTPFPQFPSRTPFPSRFPFPSRTSFPSRTPIPSVVIADPLCLTGVTGVLRGTSVCCAKRCGRCGGSMCARSPGGAANCCIPRIMSAKVSCTVAGPPCVLPAAPPSPSMTPTPSKINADSTCSTGILGNHPKGTVCCAKSCRVCGGPMCARNPGGAVNCCMPRIISGGQLCRTNLPPCIVSLVANTPSVTPTPTKATSDPTCLTGTRGTRPDGVAACCAKSCRTCGGSMCANEPGGVTNCCIANIVANQPSCSVALPPCKLWCNFRK